MKILRTLPLLFLTVYLPLPGSLASVADDSAAARPVLSLTRANSGEQVLATVGQTIQVDLESLAGAGYGTPQVSSPHVEYRNSVLEMPPNPGGLLPVPKERDALRKAARERERGASTRLNAIDEPREGHPRRQRMSVRRE